MSKTIELTQGKVAIVDDADFEWLNSFKWSVRYYGNNWYARRSTDKVQMGRFILGLEAHSQLQCDHINHNGLDNRRCNLRPVTIAENQHNQRVRQNGQSRYKGVYREKKGKYIYWRAMVRLKDKRFRSRLHHDEKDAALAYNEMAQKVFGEFACLNKV